MSTSSKITTRICAILSDGNQFSKDEIARIAEEYAALCRRTVGRLERCRQQLSSGMTSEAMRIADEQLNDAYGSALSLEPLLREYRLAVRKRNIADAVRLLRRIQILDSDNPDWKNDLISFERKRKEEIVSEFQRAKAMKDARAMQQLLDEHEECFVSDDDEDALAEMRKTIDGIYQAEATVCGNELVEEISLAYAALDYERTKQAMGSYDLLVKQGHFFPEQAILRQYEEAHEWYLEEKRQREAELLYNEQVATLREAVESGDGATADRTLNVLTRHDRSVPDRLQQRAAVLIADYRAMRERRRMRKLVAVVAGILLFVGATLFYLNQQRQKEKEHVAATEIEEAFDALNLERFDDTMQRLQREQKRVYQSSAIQHWVDQRTKLVRILEDNATVVSNRFVALELIRRNGFVAPEAVISENIEQLRNLVDDPISVSRLDSLRAEWDAYKMQLQAQRDKKLSKELNVLEKALQKIRKQRVDGLAVTAQQLRILNGMVDSIRACDSASPELRKQAENYISSVEKMRELYAARKKLFVDIKSVDSLRNYLTAIKTFVVLFPKDILSNELLQIVEMSTAYKNAIIQPTIKVPTGSVWYATQKTINDIEESTTANLEMVQDDVLALSSDKLYCNLWQIEYKNIDGSVEYIFFKGHPKKAYAKGVPCLKGESCSQTQNSRTIDFHPQDYPFQRIRTKPKKMAHCRELPVAIAPLIGCGAHDAISDYYQTLFSLFGEKSKTPDLLRVRVGGFIVEKLILLMGDGASPALRETLNELRGVAPNLHWMCIANSGAKAANTQARRCLDSLLWDTSPFRESYAEYLAANMALKRRVKWVGYVSLKAPLTPIWRKSPIPKEYWVLRFNKRYDTYEWLLAKDANNKAHYVQLMPGEPLFAPRDQHSTRALIRELKERSGYANTREMKWPDAWPQNGTF